MMKKLFIACVAGSLLLPAACSKSKPDDPGQLLAYGVIYLSSIWQRVTVADVDPNFTYNGLAPGCACPPSLEATTGKTTAYNPEFAFFVKRGSVNNLLIFFMGGGACWDITNCAYNHTYSGQLIESNLLLGLGTTGFLSGQGVGGIVDTSNPDNPFRDWTIVWVPYCTADLGMGQRDNLYPEDYGTAYPGGVTIRHRGRVNVELVLQWLQNNITTPPDKLFVTGSSAGSYSAVLSFPLIRDVFPPSSTKAYVLGDAGEGVTGTDNNGKKFMEIVEGIWGLKLPATVFGGDPLSLYDYEYKKLVQKIVDSYPDDKFAQYTTKWDKTQIWFYDIQKGNNIHLPGTWGAEEDAAADPTSLIAIEWNGLMKPPGGVIVISATNSNYWYYIGPGTHHTIMVTSTFYTEESAGTYFFDWVTAFVNDEAMSDIVCSDPTVCDEP